MDNEVSLKYKIDLTSDTTSLPTGMKFYEDASYQKEIDLLPSSEAQEDLTGELTYPITAKETRTIYWKWDNNEEDTNFDQAMISLNIKITIEQFS